MTQTLYLDLTFMSQRGAFYLFYKNYPFVCEYIFDFSIIVLNSDIIFVMAHYFPVLKKILDTNVFCRFKHNVYRIWIGSRITIRWVFK